MKISIWKVSGRYRNKNSKYNVLLFWPHVAGGISRLSGPAWSLTSFQVKGVCRNGDQQWWFKHLMARRAGNRGGASLPGNNKLSNWSVCKQTSKQVSLCCRPFPFEICI